MKRLLPVVLSLILTGCSYGLFSTAYERPKLDLPPVWQESRHVGSQAMPNDKWWREFADPRLDRLAEAVMGENLDLARAALALRQARLQAGLAAGNLWPTLSISDGFEVDRTVGSGGGSTRTFSLNSSISYEADLFGRLISVRDAERWRAEATSYDLQATRLSLSATLVSQYFQLAAIHEELRLSTASIAYARKTLDLTRAQYATGAVGRLETLEAERALASQLANHDALRQNEVATRQTLALLFDQAPEHVRLEEPNDLMRAVIPEAAPGLPVAILARRPDLAAAEANLRASLASADAARLNLYPRLTLTGSFGGANGNWTRVLSDPVATLGAGLVLPFVNWRQMRRQLAVSVADYRLAVITFRQSLYRALSEVEICLSATEKLKKQGGQLETMLAAARQSEMLYEARYRAGAVPLQSWLDAQERRRQAEISLIENRLAQLVNQANLAKALGGGASRLDWNAPGDDE